MKTCIIAIARLEGEYIREWVEHHLSLGFDKIFIGDNNIDNIDNPNDVENLGHILSNYIADNKVEILDLTSKEDNQYKFYNDMLYNEPLNNEFDWMLFIDIDEFLFLNKHNNVSDYLSQEHFNMSDVIKINWMTMTDGGHLINTGKPVLERMPIPAPNYILETTVKDIAVFKNQTIKSFVRTKLIYRLPVENLVHTIRSQYAQDVHRIRYSYNDGTEINEMHDSYPVWSQFTPEINHKDAYIKHFQTKTVEEFVKYKMLRGWSCFQDDYENTINNCVNKEMFFSINGYSPIVDKMFDELIKRYKIKYNERR